MFTRLFPKITGTKSGRKKKLDIDVFVMGDDLEGKFDFLSEYYDVLYLPCTVGISTIMYKNSAYYYILVHPGGI